MAITDAEFERIKQNLPRVVAKSFTDADQMYRTGRAFLAIDLLKRLPYHFNWAISYPTVEELAVAQDGLIVIDAGPTASIELIYKLLTEAMFTKEGYADWRIMSLLNRAGFMVIRDFTNTEDDSYLIRTIRGHFAIYPPEV